MDAMEAPSMGLDLPAATVDMTAKAGKRYVMMAIAIGSSNDYIDENQQLFERLQQSDDGRRSFVRMDGFGWWWVS